MNSSKKSEKEIDVKVVSAIWHENLKKTTNKCFFRFYSEQSRYLVLMGGAGSGKSIFAGRKLLERISSEENHRILVVRKVARTIRESCFAQLCGQISEHYNSDDFTVNKTDMLITHKNKSKILFAGLDDVEKLKSIYNITSIWIEEASEITQADFNQLDIRLRGKTSCYKQIIVTFNPVDINHWLKKRFFDRQNKDVCTHRSTYKNNEFLDDEAKKVLEGYKDTDEYYYTVYCSGEWGVYGKSIFPSDKLSKRLSDLNDIFSKGSFDFSYDGLNIRDISFSENSEGIVSIYEYPVCKNRYVIGADTAGEGSDLSVAQVVNNDTGNQAATLICEYDEDIFAAQLYCLGMFYNEALIGVEANFSSYPIRELERLNYKNQYVRESEDTFTGKIKHSYGFRTTAVTRPIIISELVKTVRDNTDKLNNRKTIEEMITFVRNEKGRAEAMNGTHDDTVMALAIAEYIRAQQGYGDIYSAYESIYNFEFEKPKKDILGMGEEMRMI